MTCRLRQSKTVFSSWISILRCSFPQRPCTDPESSCGFSRTLEASGPQEEGCSLFRFVEVKHTDPFFFAHKEWERSRQLTGPSWGETNHPRRESINHRRYIQNLECSTISLNVTSKNVLSHSKLVFLCATKFSWDWSPRWTYDFIVVDKKHPQINMLVFAPGV